MAGSKRSGVDRHTPGPWMVRGEAEPGAPPAERMFGVAPATNDRPGGCLLHIATGIQRLPDARLIAAAPDLAVVLLHLLTTPACSADGLDQQTRAAIEAGWALLVRVAPNLEVWP